MNKTRGNSVVVIVLLLVLNFSPMCSFITSSNGEEITNQTSIHIDEYAKDGANRATRDSKEWIVYNDMEPRVSSGTTNNAHNVTEYDYSTINGILKNFETGENLSITITGETNHASEYEDGDNTASGTDAGTIFGTASHRIVDLRGISQMDDESYYHTITFNNLDPTKEYVITLTANRDRSPYENARYTKVSIEGAETFIQASSSGVIINSEDSVSFSTGYNTINGYVAKWTRVTSGSDSCFSIKSEWDSSQGSGTSNTKGYAMSAFCLEEVTPVAENFTIIPLPDTQAYSQSYPAIYTNQTQWIVTHKDKLNIVYVGHEGDIVNTANSSAQWDNANTSMSYLEDPVSTGFTDGMCYSVVRGNHDLGSLYDEYFGVSRFEGRSYYGGHYSDNNQNNYILFDVGDLHFISISIDYDPDTNELNWADSILKTYSNRRAIVISHSILYNPAADWTGPGLNIYNALKDNPNLFLMLCGHMHYEARRTDTYEGNTIHTLLADYQDYPNGGNGYLRIMEFCPATDEIKVKTYSPWLNQYQTDDDSQFTLTYNMSSIHPSEDEPPSVVLDSPVNNSMETTPTIQLNCTATDNVDLHNLTLYIGSADHGTGGSVSVQVSDDAEEDKDSGEVDLTSSDLELCYDSGYGSSLSQVIGTRFNDVQIPQGATITSAYVEFECDEEDTGNVPVEIRGEAVDDAATFTDADYDLSSRTTTSAMVDWTITSEWTVNNKYSTEDISSIVQEIVDRPGWISGNSMAILFNSTSSNARIAESYDGEEAAAPRLVVEYTTGVVGSLVWHAHETKTITGTTNTTSFIITLLDGTYRWNCLAYDEAGNSGFAATDNIFTIVSETPVYYTLTINVVGNGSVTPTSGSSYLAGTIVAIEAIPDSGYILDSWSGDLTGNMNPTTITMIANKTINATFILQPPSPGWIAYNDFSGLDPINVGTISTGDSGNLINYATGETLPVTLTVGGGGDGGESEGTLISGTDAYDVFYGITDPSEDIWYYGDDHTLDFTGLDPSKTYRFVHYANRGKDTYVDRLSNVIISDVNGFDTNSSSAVSISTTMITDDTATYCGGYNPEGYVAGFTNITPGSDGDFTITVGSDDDHEYTTAIMLQEISAGSINTPPIVDDIPDQMIGEGGSFAAISLDDFVEDAEDVDVNISWFYSGNSELTVSIVDRIATILVPSVDWFGKEVIMFMALDSDGLYDFDGAVFNVRGVNDAPVITTTDLISGLEDVAYTVNYEAMDSDIGDILTWGLVTDAGFLSIDSGSGLLSGTPVNDDVGLFFVNVSVSDGHGGFDFHNFTLVVGNTNDAPSIVNSDITNATENELYSVDYEVFDLDSYDSFIWSVITNASFLSINITDGILSGTPDESDIGSYFVNVSVLDGDGGIDFTNFSLTVTEDNLPDEQEIPTTSFNTVEDTSNKIIPIVNNQPISDGSNNEPYAGVIGEELLFDGSLSYDPDDNDYIMKWFWNFGDGANDSGEKVSHTYVKEGSYTLTLSVWDNHGAKCNEEYSTIVEISKLNIPPSEPMINGPLQGIINSSYTYTVKLIDEDDDQLQYNITWGDSGVIETNIVTQGEEVQLTHTWETLGKYKITITAYDGLSESKTVTICVYIDVFLIDDDIFGYLIDTNSDGIYDQYEDYDTGARNSIKQQNNSYFIDSNGNGKFEYIFNFGAESLHEYTKEIGITNTTSIMTLVLVLIIEIIGMSILLFKKRNFNLFDYQTSNGVYKNYRKKYKKIHKRARKH